MRDTCVTKTGPRIEVGGWFWEYPEDLRLDSLSSSSQGGLRRCVYPGKGCMQPELFAGFPLKSPFSALLRSFRPFPPFVKTLDLQDGGYPRRPAGRDVPAGIRNSRRGNQLQVRRCGKASADLTTWTTILMNVCPAAPRLIGRNVSMDSDKAMCVRMEVGDAKSVQIVSLASGTITNKFPMAAESAVLSPDGKSIAVRGACRWCCRAVGTPLHATCRPAPPCSWHRAPGVQPRAAEEDQKLQAPRHGGRAVLDVDLVQHHRDRDGELGVPLGG